jgi:hypothetical protein
VKEEAVDDELFSVLFFSSFLFIFPFLSSVSSFRLVHSRFISFCIFRHASPPLSAYTLRFPRSDLVQFAIARSSFATTPIHSIQLFPLPSTRLVLLMHLSSSHLVFIIFLFRYPILCVVPLVVFDVLPPTPMRYGHLHTPPEMTLLGLSYTTVPRAGPRMKGLDRPRHSHDSESIKRCPQPPSNLPSSTPLVSQSRSSPVRTSRQGFQNAIFVREARTAAGEKSVTNSPAACRPNSDVRRR